MNIEETYNIHKKINCVFPFFKSKLLCKKGIHNYQLKRKQKETKEKSFRCETEALFLCYKTIWQCRCCKAETKFEGGNTNE